VDVPVVDANRPGAGRILPPATSGRGRVRAVHGWTALVETGGRGTTVPVESLLAANVRLLEGQPARHRDEWWTIVGHDPADSTVLLARGDTALSAPVADLFSQENLCRWWWHVPGAERTEYSSVAGPG